MKESVIYQEIKQEGRLEGKIEGKIEGKASLILRLFTRKFGVISTKLNQEIQSLSIEQCQQLSMNADDIATAKAVRTLDREYIRSHLEDSQIFRFVYESDS